MQESENIQSIEIILDYKGVKLADHKMDLSEFIQSITGLKQLLEIVAKEYGHDSKSLEIYIGSIENGSLKTKIIPALLFSGGVVAGHYGDKALNFIDNQIIRLWESASEFITTKKEVQKSEDFAKNLGNVSTIQASLYTNPAAHTSVAQFTKCLDFGVEEIQMRSSEAPKYDLNLYPEDRPALETTPFEETIEEEHSETVNMRLFLVGVNLDTSAKWQFHDKTGKKTKNVNAVVLDNDLLQMGIEKALVEFKNKPLLCTVIIKTIKKEGAQRSTKEFFITKCSIDNDGLLAE